MNKQFRVFLSSSFQDMHAERDYLKCHAFAALQAELYQNGCDLQILDLRGTTTEPDLSQEEAVLRLCLNGVEECIPRMVVLMGDRYGWVPYGEGAEYLDDQAKNRAELSVQNISDAPNLDITKEEIAGRSVTHLEIYYGLKHMPHDDIFVYQRKGLPYERMSDAQRALFCYGFESQQALKTEINEKMGGHTENLREYSVGWDSDHSSVTDLEALDGMIYSDLKASFERELASDQTEDISGTQDSEYILTTLAQSTMRCNAVGDYDPPLEFREKLQQILDHPGAYWITGESGSGVTTYTAQLCHSLVLYARMREKRGERPVLVVKYTAESHAHTPSADIMMIQLLEQMENAAIDLCPMEEWDDFKLAIEECIEKLNDYSEDRNNRALKKEAVDISTNLLRRFLELLLSAYEVFIVLCDIDMLVGEDEEDRTLYWLHDIPDAVTVVFSAVEGSLMPSINYMILPVPSLSAPIIYDIMTATAKEYGKRFADEILELAAEKLLSSGHATTLHVRVLAECLMNMTAPDYRAFSGPDAHLDFMRNLIAEIPGYVDGVFDVMIHRAKLAYGDLAVAAFRLLWVSRAAVPDSFFKEALSADLGRDVSDMELFSLRGYLKSSLKNQRSIVTWQLAHQSLRYALDTHMEDAVLDSAAAMLQTLRNHLGENSFIISEFLWYGYWAGDPTAVVDYIDAFYDNTFVKHEMVFLFRNKLRCDEGNWFEYLKRAVEPLCSDHGNLVDVFCTLCVIAPDTQFDFDAYDELLKTYLSAADHILPQKLAAQLHQRYSDWFLTSDIVRGDETKFVNGLRALEEASLKAINFLDSKEDWKEMVAFLADVLYAQTMLCNQMIFEDFEDAKVCFERSVSTFDRLGDEGVRHLIEIRQLSFLEIMGIYFVLYFMIYGTSTPELLRKMGTYIELLENQEQNHEVMSARFKLYKALHKVLQIGREPLNVNSDNEYIPNSTDEEIFACEKKLVDLGDTLYPRMLRSSEFIDTYLQAFMDLAVNQELRLRDSEAAETRKEYIKTIMNLHDNKIMSDDEVADSQIYKISVDYVKYELGENEENWELIIDYLDQMIKWMDACRPDELRLYVRQTASLLLKVKYSVRSEEYDEQETERFLQNAISLTLSLPERLSEYDSVKTTENDKREVIYEILEVLASAYVELITREMIQDAGQMAETFRSICLNWIDRPFVLDAEDGARSQLSEEYNMSINDQLQENRRLSKELVILLIDIMEVSLESQHASLKKQLTDIRDAVVARQ